LENDVLPGSLGDLKLKHLKKGYAKAIKENDWLTKLSYFFVKINTPSQVYAQFLTPGNLEKYGVDPQIFNCPADTNGAPSYGIKQGVAGMRWEEIMPGEVIVGDCDNYTFSDETGLAERHIKNLGLQRVALGITPQREMKGCAHGSCIPLHAIARRVREMTDMEGENLQAEDEGETETEEQ
jgi:hypothetical protein